VYINNKEHIKRASFVYINNKEHLKRARETRAKKGNGIFLLNPSIAEAEQDTRKTKDFRVEEALIVLGIFSEGEQGSPAVLLLSSLKMLCGWGCMAQCCFQCIENLITNCCSSVTCHRHAFQFTGRYSACHKQVTLANICLSNSHLVMDSLLNARA
jgi:hypothetical protein